MSVDAQYTLVEVAAGAAAGGSRALAPISERAFLGFGLIRPFRRARKTDFAAGGGVELVRSALTQVLNTRADSGRQTGELPWRPEFGSWLHLLRFSNQDGVFEDVARVYVGDAVRRWEPRVRVKSVQVKRLLDSDSTTALVRILFDVVSEASESNNVLIKNEVVDIPLAA